MCYTNSSNCNVFVSTMLYTVACSQPISLVGEHCSGAQRRCSAGSQSSVESWADSQSVELVSCGLSSVQSTCSEVVIFVTAAAVGPSSC